jgi:DNA invertase Pin-like site-specific DNA recombinase
MSKKSVVKTPTVPNFKRCYSISVLVMWLMCILWTDLLNLVEEITNKGAKIVFHKENLIFAHDKQDPYQKMMMTMLGAVAELERNLILERQREGIALAKLKGKYKGGQHKLTNEQAEEIKTLVNNRTPMTTIAKQFNISRRTVYNYL